MQRALDDICTRFPTFCAAVHNGLFWNYFERTTVQPKLKAETAVPGRPIDTERTLQPNFRVLYYKRRITLEVFHGVADGGGSIRFLTSLVARYYELQGETFGSAPHVLRVGDPVTSEETDDPFVRNSSAGVKAKNYQKVEAFRLRDPFLKDRMRVVHGFMRVDDLKEAAGEYGLTVTEYLAAVLILTYIKTVPAPIEKSINLSIPLDLRRRFGTGSVRNFCYMSDIAYHPQGRQDVEFSEICGAIAGKVQEKASLEYLSREISANVRAQQSPLLRPIPYPLKHLFLMDTYRRNQNSFTAFLSNIGEVLAPPALLRHIARAEFTLGETPHNPLGIGVISVDGLLTVTFNDCCDDTDKERFFFRFLASQGIPLRIESNRK